MKNKIAATWAQLQRANFQVVASDFLSCVVIIIANHGSIPSHAISARHGH